MPNLAGLNAQAIVVRLPVPRARALIRALLLAMPALVLLTASVAVVRHLLAQPSGVGTRAVDSAIVVLSLPLPLLAAIFAWRAVRWLALALWPAPVGAFADREGLTLRLGWFVRQRFDARRMDICYPFELSEEEADGSVEAFLPPEQQFATMLPRILHPEADEPLNRTLLRYTLGSQEAAAAALRPVIEQWRAQTEDEANVDQPATPDAQASSAEDEPS